MLQLLNFFASCPKGSVQSQYLSATPCGSTGLPAVGASSNQLGHILTIAFATLAAVAVLFIIIGGFRFVISSGDPEDMSKAKNTIIYSVVGLVIVLTAGGIVSFVLGYL